MLIECFHLKSEILVNAFQDLSQKNITGGLMTFVGNSHVYQAPKSTCFIATRAIRAHKSLFNV